MKKTISLLILAALVLSLAACAGHGDPQNAQSPSAPSPTPDMTDILTASATNAAAAKTPPASDTNAQAVQTQAAAGTLDQALFEKAKACIGRNVQELYDAVGQPAETPVYGPSCLQEGAEDGIMAYPGFSVWTVRTDTDETVHDVYVNE